MNDVHHAIVAGLAKELGVMCHIIKLNAHISGIYDITWYAWYFLTKAISIVIVDDKIYLCSEITENLKDLKNAFDLNDPNLVQLIQDHLGRNR